MENILVEFAVVVSLAAGLSLVFRLFRQPAILAYILTGIIVGPLGLYKLADQTFIRVLAEFGITLLLFMMGLEIKLSDFRYVGKVIAFASVGQIVLTFLSSYFIAFVFGYSQIISLYIGACLTLSSTIVIVKFLSDKRDLNSLYGRISVGILLAQDFLVILLLMLLSGLSPAASGVEAFDKFAPTLFKGALIFGVLYYLSKRVFPKVVEFLAKSDESLFLVSIAWLLALSAIISSRFIGFSVEIGGFLAGLSLANSIANYQIIARAKILRDFFIVLFFVLLGIQIGFADFGKILLPGIILSIFVLVGKPLLVIFLVSIVGYKKRTAYLTGINFGQISEFSLILIFLGNKLGHVPHEAVSLVAFVSIVSFAISTYVILNGKKLYLSFGKYMFFIKKNDGHRENASSPDSLSGLSKHIIIIGGEQMGEAVIDALEGSEKEIVVVDFDPDIVQRLSEKNVHRVFGDISDIDIQDRINIDKSALVISTVPDVEDNLALIKRLKNKNKNVDIIVMAFSPNDAKELYQYGADYVVLPHLAGGKQIAQILRKSNLEGNTLQNLREKDLAYLRRA